MVEYIKSRVRRAHEHKKLDHQRRKMRRKKWFGRFLAVFGVLLIVFGLVFYLAETGKISFKKASDSVKIAKTIEKKISSSSSQEPVKTSSSSSEVQTTETEPPAPSVITPMTEERFDRDDNYTKQGKIIINKVGLELEIVKGLGSTDDIAYDKLFYACTNKLDQVLGQNNYVLSAHSSSINPLEAFSPILNYEDGSNNPHRPLDVSKLALKVNDLVTVYQNSNQTYYTFKITSIRGFDDISSQEAWDVFADTEGKPQLTLYACSAVGNNDDGRIVVQADFVSSKK